MWRVLSFNIYLDDTWIIRIEVVYVALELEWRLEIVYVPLELEWRLDIVYVALELKWRLEIIYVAPELEWPLEVVNVAPELEWPLDIVYVALELEWRHPIRYFQLATTDFINSTNHGVGKQWVYTLRYLADSTVYKISVESENSAGHRSAFAKPFLVFETRGKDVVVCLYRFWYCSILLLTHQSKSVCSYLSNASYWDE